jgi:FkbM family methyltransferase
MRYTKLSRVLKNVYLSLPLKNFYKLIRRFGKLKKKHYWYLRFRGIFTVPVDASHSFKVKHYGFSIENSVFWAGLTGEWEASSMKLWIQLVKDADVIFDVGANTGMYSLVAKSLRPQSRVYAFEPVRRIFEKLQYNQKLNNYDTTCLEYAASNANGTATIYDLPTDHVYSVTVNKNLNAADVHVIPTEIKTIRLDTFINEAKIEKLDLIKLDVETYEAEVIEGLGVYLEKFKPAILVEVLNDKIGSRLQQLFEGKGYLYFTINEDTGQVTLTEHIKRDIDFNFLICTEEIARKINLIQ